MSEILFSQKRLDQEQMVCEYIFDHGGLVRTSDLMKLDIDYRLLMDMLKRGSIKRVKNGYYALPDEKYTEEELLTKLFPDAVLTMESALYAYGILKDKPYTWMLAVDKNTSKSRFKIDFPMIKPYYTEPEVLKLGVTSIEHGGQTMQIYTKDRLVCDVLKYEEKLDRQIFKTAVWSYIMDETKDVAKLMEYARERKVAKKVQSMIGVWL